jgi:hypothetical protein
LTIQAGDHVLAAFVNVPERRLQLAGFQVSTTGRFWVSTEVRRTHIDVLREAGVDPAVEHATVGHSSHRMREHYSTIRDDERQRAAEAVAQRLVPKRESNGSLGGSDATTPDQPLGQPGVIT